VGAGPLRKQSGSVEIPGHLLGWCNAVNMPPDYILEKFPLFTVFSSSAPGVVPSGGQRAWMPRDTCLAIQALKPTDPEHILRA